MRSLPSIFLTALGLFACGGGPATTTGDATTTDTSGSTSTGGSSGSSDAPTTSTDPGASSTGGGPSSTGAGPGSTGGAAGCPAQPLGPGEHIRTIEHDGMMRTAQVHVPPGIDPQAPASLVLNFHGFGSNAGQQSFFSGMSALADSEGFIVVYPQGVADSWNAGACCGDAVTQNIDDVGFTRALVAALSDELCIDPARIFSTGMSNGGFFSHRLACEAADLVAAFAPVSAVNGMPTCEPSRPVPLLMFNGTADPLVDYNLVAPSFAAWGQRDGCTGDPVAGQTIGAASSEAYTTCDAGVSVTQWTLEGMGHCWPGKEFCPFGMSNLDVDANTEIWAFFSQNPLPGA